MSVYDQYISATDADPLIPEEATAEVFKATTENSAVLSLCRQLPNMSTGTLRMPVVDSLPIAYFVDGDLGLKKTSDQAWKNVSIEAEELAVIIPIPQSVIDDSAYPIWSQIMPSIGEALGLAIDQAMMFGTNAPAAWPDDFATACAAAANSVEYGAGADLYEDILGETGALSLLEADGYDMTGMVAKRSLRGIMRDTRTTEGLPIWGQNLPTGQANYNVDGVMPVFPTNGSFQGQTQLAFMGDFSQIVYSVRQDISFKVFDSGVITDAAGLVVKNLMQQDAVALRVVMRLGWNVPNPENREEPTEANRYPLVLLANAV